MLVRVEKMTPHILYLSRVRVRVEVRVETESGSGLAAGFWFGPMYSAW